MESIPSVIGFWISSNSIWLAAGGAFVGGALTAMSPCIIAMVPLLIGFIAGMEGELTTRRSFFLTLAFVAGFSVELALLFTVGFAAAPFLQSQYMIYVLAIMCILLGLHFLDLLHIPAAISQDRVPKLTGFVGAAVFGFMFGLVSLPCTGPALLLIVSVIPVKGFWLGGIMMVLYGVGHCLFILCVGTSAGLAKRLLGSHRLHTTNLYMKRAGGIMLTLLGIYIGIGAYFPSLGFPL
ncbi:cytochrome c biogenesis CcdA family protein [Thermodesulfobacteriota bacterium]